jgi:hypothetical protein
MLIFKRIEINLAKNNLISVTVEFWQKFEGLKEPDEAFVDFSRVRLALGLSKGRSWF